MWRNSIGRPDRADALSTRWRRLTRLSLTLALAAIVPAWSLGCSPAATAHGAVSATSGLPPGSVLPPSSVLAPGSALPPGSPLPDDATCAARVQPASEVRPDNAPYNMTRGTQKNLTGPTPMFSRVDGNFTGTTDEIIQWTACKWGIDVDIVRAQAVIESFWHQQTLSDTTSNAAVCAPHHPIGSDAKHPGQCPESVGLLQVRYQYWTNGFDEVETSTAYNSDYAYAAWRSCYDGEDTWLNTAERVGTYGPGDTWGCVGLWFAGRWHTSPAETYIGKVKDALNQRTWTTASFARG